MRFLFWKVKTNESHFMLLTTVFPQLLIVNFDDTRQNFASTANSHRREKVVDYILPCLSAALGQISAILIVMISLQADQFWCCLGSRTLFLFPAFHDASFTECVKITPGNNVSPEYRSSSREMLKAYPVHSEWRDKNMKNMIKVIFSVPSEKFTKY